jgi:hypothetical protein
MGGEISPRNQGELEKQIEENEDKIKRVDRLQEKVDRNRERSWDREMSRR